jgi:hypothetical protein
MPSRLIQLNGMNINAGGLIEFHATMQPASQVSCAAKFELVISPKIAKAFGLEICASVKMSVCNFDHNRRIAAGASQKMRSTILIDQPSDAPMCKVWMEPMATTVSQVGRP